jgi:hypothetical protein
MKSKPPGDPGNQGLPERIAPGEIRISREAIRAAEKVLGRSLRSAAPQRTKENVPDR